MLETYRKYYFATGDSLEQLQQEYTSNDILILEKTDPIQGIIGYKNKSKASHSHILTIDELKGYLGRSTTYKEHKNTMVKKAKQLSKFAISKDEDLIKRLALPFIIVLVEIFLIASLTSIPLLQDKKEDLLILILEIVGTTLTFFFSFSYLEEENYALLWKPNDKRKNSETRFVNRIFAVLSYS